MSISDSTPGAYERPASLAAEVAASEPGTVLLERAPTASSPGRTLLFRSPARVIFARQPQEVLPALIAAQQALEEGFYLAGYVAYEAGFALEPSLASLAAPLPGEEPLLWFGCYAQPLEESTGSFPAPQEYVAQTVTYSFEEQEYTRRVERVRELIAQGDTYQANLTMDARWHADESAAELYRRLLREQPVPYAALLHPDSSSHILSFSPELFFTRTGDRIVTRPMKGTAAPGLDLAERRAQATWLAADEKNRAENVMIVDLLRNDLGRICCTGSVTVSDLFHVEALPTVLQMTSTVEGLLRPGIGLPELFTALFPSGSIVGAPKVHTMRLLHALEGRLRGVYTGAIGYVSPNGDAEFSVAIRTVTLRNGEARMGVGSGIVFDSEPALEYEECRTKTAFLTRQPTPEFQLIETLRCEQGTYPFLDLHLERLAQSAEYLGFAFDVEQIKELLHMCSNSHPDARVRLLLDRKGHATATASTLPAADVAPVAVMMHSQCTDAADRFLRHKTTNRALYDEAYREAQADGFADAIFLNTRGELTEGAIHNLILVLDGAWLTPPLRSGVLPGVYRQHLLRSGRLRERVLTREDLDRAEEVYLCNGVRGLRRVGQITP